MYHCIFKFIMFQQNVGVFAQNETCSSATLCLDSAAIPATFGLLHLGAISGNWQVFGHELASGS